MNPPAVLVRTAALREVGLFNEKMRQLVDMEMWVRLMAVSHVGYICKALASLRVHPQRASNRHACEEIIRLDYDCLYDTLENTNNLPVATLAGSACAAIGASSPTSVTCVSCKVVSSAAEALCFGMIKDIVRAIVPHYIYWLGLHRIKAGCPPARSST